MFRRVCLDINSRLENEKKKENSCLNDAIKYDGIYLDSWETFFNFWVNYLMV